MCSSARGLGWPAPSQILDSLQRFPKAAFPDLVTFPTGILAGRAGPYRKHEYLGAQEQGVVALDGVSA